MTEGQNSCCIAERTMRQIAREEVARFDSAIEAVERLLLDCDLAMRGEGRNYIPVRMGMDARAVREALEQLR